MPTSAAIDFAPLSLSARRAWIEMTCRVDFFFGCWSLSARRAWIEIGLNFARKIRLAAVALRKESVDRNPSSTRRLLMSVGRSPQGERG